MNNQTINKPVAIIFFMTQEIIENPWVCALDKCYSCVINIWYEIHILSLVTDRVLLTFEKLVIYDSIPSTATIFFSFYIQMNYLYN